MNEQIFEGLRAIYLCTVDRGITLRRDPQVLEAARWIAGVLDEWEQGKVKPARPTRRCRYCGQR